MQIYISYAARDKRLLEHLEEHLSALRRQNIITTWQNRKIIPGADFATEISDQLENADIILLLVSPSFLSSDANYVVELKKALQMREQGKATVIPVLLTHVDVQGLDFDNLMMLPDDRVPVDDRKWNNRNEALHNVVMGIRRVIKSRQPRSVEPGKGGEGNADTHADKEDLMSKLRLEGNEIGQFKELLSAAFLRVRFDEFLLYRLNKSTDDLAGFHDDYSTVLRKVIQEANAKLWWRDLLREARNAVPADPGLVAFAEQFGLSPTTVTLDNGMMTPVTGKQLELRIKAAQSTFDIMTWRNKLGEIEGRVCRIEFPELVGQATGVLIGPNAVLTNYHVIKPILDGKVTPDQIALRFDYKVFDGGVGVLPGTVYRVAGDWLFDSSPFSARDEEVNPSADPNPDELDYAILRVDGTPGDDPVGGETNDPNPTPRKWIDLPVGVYDFLAQPALYIVQHPDGKPMQVALDSEAVVGINGNATRVRYTTTTEPGSSGSPCFGPDWQWVALHHAGDPKFWKEGKKPEFNQGIPLSAIQALLAQNNKSYVFGNPI